MVDEPGLFKTNTRFNSISIETDPQFWTLRTANNNIQSRINRQNPQHLELRNLVYLSGILLFTPPPEKICLLGIGGGGLIHFFRYYYPDSHITAVEIDGDLLDIIQQQMDLPPGSQHLTYQVDDAAHYLDSCQQKFDLILVDLFFGDKIPLWLLKPTTMRQIYERLNRHGGVGYNLLINSEQDFATFYKNLRQIFHQQTLCLPVEDLDNIIAFAIREPSEVCDMQQNMEKAIMLGDCHDQNYIQVLSSIYSTNPAGSGVI